jgi:hypothetical protein
VSETPKLFCKDCRHLCRFNFDAVRCGVGRKLDPVRGDVIDWQDPREKNKGFDCADFEVKPPPNPPIPFEEPIPEPAPVKSSGDRISSLVVAVFLCVVFAVLLGAFILVSR